MQALRADRASVIEALDAAGGTIPGYEEATIKLGPPDENGISEISLEGSPHASVERVLRVLGVPVAPAARIAAMGRPAHSQAYVESEPGRLQGDNG